MSAERKPSSQAERRRAFAILFCSLLCMGIGQSVIYTVLPPVGRQLGIGAVRVTSIFAASATIWIFSSTFWGRRSDHLGRKPVMLVGLIAFGVSFLGFASMLWAGLNRWLPAGWVFPLLVASRCIYGGFGSGTSAAAQAYVADRTSATERLGGIAIVSMAFALGTTIGPAIGSALSIFGLLAPLYFVAAFAIASAASIFLLLPERTTPKLHARSSGALRWYERRMLPFTGFGVILSMAASIPIQIAGFFFMDVLHDEPGRAAQHTGIGLMLSAVAALFAQFVVVQRSGLSARVLTSVGLMVAAVSNFLFLVPGHIAITMAALFISGLGFGLARPGFTTGASLSVSPQEQGTVAGILNAAAAAGFIFGPLIGWLYELSPFIPFVFGSVMMLALLVWQYGSRVLRGAGELPPTLKIVEETAETPLSAS